MTAIVFAGPTLFGVARAFGPHIVLRPPARQGDLYDAARTKPDAIGLIDGRFETVPSVWHKEILWALSRGVPVYGAASMGALRAAELAPFGMVGVGAIYEEYRRGRVERDDAVAVLHAPEDEDFRPLSEALVDMRATLAKATHAGIVSRRTARRLEDRAGQIFFKERSWERLLAAADDVPSRQRDALRRWLPAGRVALKQRDALALMAVIKRGLAGPPKPFRANFVFQRTAFWQAVARPQAQAGRIASRRA